MNKFPHYFKVLADKSTNGSMDLLLAEHYLKNEGWGLAQKNIENCMAKGKMHNPFKAQKIQKEISTKLTS